MDRSEAATRMEQWLQDNEPLLWTGKYVYIPSIEAIGYVKTSSQYSGSPHLNTITVTLLDENGRWSADGLTVTYTMAEAKEALVPNDIRTLIQESPL